MQIKNNKIYIIQSLDKNESRRYWKEILTMNELLEEIENIVEMSKSQSSYYKWNI